MNEKQQILDAARRMEADPPRSKLDDYAEVIWELRCKRKRICTITAFLNQHGIRVGKSTVARWLKRHPVPKTTSQGRTSIPLNPTAEPQAAVAKAARDFFKPSDSQHENHEPHKTELWNRPD
jgi:hypothetical protein